MLAQSFVAVSYVKSLDAYKTIPLSFDMIGNILFSSEMLNGVEGECAIERMMNGTLFDIARFNIADHVEVNRITAKLKGLSRVEHLHVRKSNMLSAWAKVHLCTELIRGGLLAKFTQETSLDLIHVILCLNWTGFVVS